MARSTRKQINALYDDVKAIAGLPSRAAAERFYLARSRLFHERFSLSLSPHMDGAWTLSAARGGGACVYFASQRVGTDWIETPDAVAASFFDRFGR